MDIEQGNKLIGEFHGWKHSPTPKQKGKGMWHFPEWGKSAFGIDDFKYHSSWDWLIPAIKKFQYSNPISNVYSNEYEEFFEWCNKIDNAITQDYDIQQAFNLFTEAIQWYNTTNKNQDAKLNS